jgi:selenocysteine-specific elongation factor
VRLLGVASVQPDGAFARVRLSAPLVLDVHDRFVLRDAGRRETVAGGVVLDPAPPRRPGADAAERLARRERTAPGELPELLVAERGAIRTDELGLLSGQARPARPPIGRWFVADAVRRAVVRAVEDWLRAFHDEHPAAEGTDPSGVHGVALRALRGAGAPASNDLATALVDDLVASGALARDGRSLRLASHRGRVADAELERVVAEVARGEPTPPTISELERSGFPRETIEAAVRAGALVRISPELVVTSGFVSVAVDAVREAGEAGVTVSDVRRRLGTSRKYAVPLLEHLDRTGATRRSGDLRFARGI